MDEQTYIEQVKKSARCLYRIARSMLWNDAMCASAVQQTVFRGWQKRRKLRNPEKLRVWLIAILIRECHSLQRQKSRDTASGNRCQDDQPARDEALEQALRELPERYRLPVLLHNLEGCAVREIADMLKLTEGRVSSRLHHAQKRLNESRTTDPMPPLNFDDAFPEMPKAIDDAIRSAAQRIEARDMKLARRKKLALLAALVFALVIGIGVIVARLDWPKRDSVTLSKVRLSEVDAETFEVYASRDDVYFHIDASCPRASKHSVALVLMTARAFEKKPCPECCRESPSP